MKVWNVPIACRMFRYALEGDAREWLKSVTKGSISSFEDLKEKFRARFSKQKKHKKIYVATHGVKQKETEPCRTFLDRFTTETEDIMDLPESQRISALLHGLRRRRLVEFLYKDLPKTYEAVQKRAYVYLDARDTAPTGDISPPHDKEAHPQRKGKWNNERERPRDHGHDTNACWQLKKAIEEAINEGKLSHLVKSVRQQYPKKEDDADDKKKGPDKTIYTIMKKKIGHSPRKAYRGSMPSITFPPIYNGRIFRDPLVISAFLGVSKVKEMVVDTGSECNVLYEEVFWKLNPLSRMNFRKAGASIQRYSGDIAEPLGKFSIQTTIGKGHLKRKEKITFTVVSRTSPFQAILGRPGIQKFGLIPSVMHGLVKYETNGKIATLVGKAKKLSDGGQDGCQEISMSDMPYYG
uniref:uncharacterized protein LOC122583301 n=1 Tax=Erigeron canadensis TaxID=72917 RepID=UPI001CB97C60|nr:uncharacterized protein LOC122583301 [Erigeron canadensis]